MRQSFIKAELGMHLCDPDTEECRISSFTSEWVKEYEVIGTYPIGEWFAAPKLVEELFGIRVPCGVNVYRVLLNNHWHTTI